MTTYKTDLYKAKILLMIYSGYDAVFKEDDPEWTFCNGHLYKTYLFEELVKEGQLLKEENKYIPSTTLYNWNWFEDVK